MASDVDVQSKCAVGRWWTGPEGDKLAEHVSARRMQDEKAKLRVEVTLHPEMGVRRIAKAGMEVKDSGRDY